MTRTVYCSTVPCVLFNKRFVTKPHSCVGSTKQDVNEQCHNNSLIGKVTGFELMCECYLRCP